MPAMVRPVPFIVIVGVPVVIGGEDLPRMM